MLKRIIVRKRKLLGINFILGILFFVGCTNEFAKYKETTFYTQDSLYKITMNLPIELDTFYTWVRKDDNECSDEKMYRFTSRKFPFQKETQLFESLFCDSAYRLTIKHINKYSCKLGMDYEKWVTPIEYHKRLETRYNESNDSFKIASVNKREIEGHLFLLSSYKVKDKYNKEFWSLHEKAVVLVDSNMFVFETECKKLNCEGFIEKMEVIINSIKIEDGK